MKKSTFIVSNDTDYSPCVCCSLSVNTFSAASGDFAKVTAIFLPLLPTKPQKAKMTDIFRNFPLFLTKPHKPE